MIINLVLNFKYTPRQGEQKLKSTYNKNIIYRKKCIKLWKNCRK